MTKRKRKIPAVDQFVYQREHNDSSGEIKLKPTEHGRVLMNIRDLCSFLDEVETYQLFRALHRVGSCQFGRTFHDECHRYITGVTVIEEGK